MITIHCDGSSMNNEGPNSDASWTIHIDGTELNTTGEYAHIDGKETWTGKGTSNEAEYKALICALWYAGKWAIGKEVVIHLDSTLVYHQVVSGTYAIRNARLSKLHEVATTLLQYALMKCLSLKIRTISSNDNLAHVVVSREPHVYDGIHTIVEEVPRMTEELRMYDEHVDRMEVENG